MIVTSTTYAYINIIHYYRTHSRFNPISTYDASMKQDDLSPSNHVSL